MNTLLSKCRGGLYALPTAGTGWDKPIPYTGNMPFEIPKHINLKKRLRLAALIIANGLAWAAFAADSPTNAPVSQLTVEALVKDVLTNNPELRFYEAELAAAKGERRTAGQWANPEVATEVGQKRSSDNAGDLQGKGLTWSVAVNQTFEWPGRVSLRKSIANGQVAIAENGLSQFRAALTARARTLVSVLDVSQQKADAAHATAERFLALHDIAEQRDTAGVTPLLEKRILEANSITYRRRKSEALQLSQQALLELNQLRGQPLTVRLKITDGNLRFAKLPDLDGLVAVALTKNLDLRQRALELERQGFRVELARNERYPSVTIGPYYSEEKSSGKDHFVGVGVSLPLPLWDHNRGNVETAAARQEQAQTSLHIAQHTVERRIIELATAYDTRLREMSHWRPDAVERFRKAAELADHHYRLGAVPIATYVEMQKQALDALDALLETQREAMESAQQLELSVGTPLNLFTVETKGSKP